MTVQARVEALVARVTQQTLTDIANMRNIDMPLPVIAEYVHMVQEQLQAAIIVLNAQEDVNRGPTFTQGSDKAM